VGSAGGDRVQAVDGKLAEEGGVLGPIDGGGVLSFNSSASNGLARPLVG